MLQALVPMLQVFTLLWLRLSLCAFKIETFWPAVAANTFFRKNFGYTLLEPRAWSSIALQLPPCCQTPSESFLGVFSLLTLWWQIDWTNETPHIKYFCSYCTGHLKESKLTFREDQMHLSTYLFFLHAFQWLKAAYKDHNAFKISPE